MKTDGYQSLGRLVGHEVGVDHTLGSQDILMEHGEVNQRLPGLCARRETCADCRQEALRACEDRRILIYRRGNAGPLSVPRRPPTPQL
jgi:hypothetical protein